MKAKEYARAYHEKIACGIERDVALWSVFKDMFDEVVATTKKRNSDSDSCLVGALKEQSEKWRAFARSADDGIRENGFYDLVLHQFRNDPQTLSAFKRYGFYR